MMTNNTYESTYPAHIDVCTISPRYDACFGFHNLPIIPYSFGRFRNFQIQSYKIHDHAPGIQMISYILPIMNVVTYIKKSR